MATKVAPRRAYFTGDLLPFAAVSVKCESSVKEHHKEESSVRERPALVIFDCDGVLVDSEPLAAAALAEALGEVGLNYSADAVDKKFRGRSLKDCLKEAEREFGGALPEDFLKRLDERTYRVFRRRLAAVAGVQAVLQSLKVCEVPLCVASSGSHEKMRLTLGLTGLLKYFEGRLFSANQVESGKPAPDLFLFAADQMGVRIEDAVVIEDSLAGVQGARQAGARVFAYCSDTDPMQAEHQKSMRLLGAEPFRAMTELSRHLHL